MTTKDYSHMTDQEKRQIYRLLLKACETTDAELILATVDHIDREWAPTATILWTETISIYRGVSEGYTIYEDGKHVVSSRNTANLVLTLRLHFPR